MDQVVRRRNQGLTFTSSGVKVQLFLQDTTSPPKRTNAFFASVNQVGKGFGISSTTSSPNPVDNSNAALLNMQLKLVSMAEPPQALMTDNNGVALRLGEVLDSGKEEVVLAAAKKKKDKKSGFKWRIKVRNPALRRLISGGIAGAISRTVVAPLETIRTHLMVGSCGHSTFEVFDNIMKSEGWTGLFRGNFVNVIRVAPSKAIELFAYDTVLKKLTPEAGKQPILPIPASSIAGGLAGVCSTLCTYPLELLKTRLTVQRGVYDNLLDALVKIVREEGPGELYRGLTPSLIGVVPYAAANYWAYDTLRKAYKKAFKKEEIGNVMTLLIGSAAGAISSTATFPLEVARKQMQAGALNGGQYTSMLHALTGILEKEGLGGLYRGLGPSCLKLVPAAGISFMCYEACKKVLVAEEECYADKVAA
ncbi:Adenine nucleotide transporter BT1, chloroplastic/mitochondrial [Linum grandiflorum]